MGVFQFVYVYVIIWCCSMILVCMRIFVIYVGNKLMWMFFEQVIEVKGGDFLEVLVLGSKQLVEVGIFIIFVVGSEVYNFFSVCWWLFV